MKPVIALILLLPFGAAAQRRISHPPRQDITVYDTIRRVTITDLLGQEVYSQAYNTNRVNVTTPALPAGQYLVRITGVRFVYCGHYYNYNEGPVSFLVTDDEGQFYL